MEVTYSASYIRLHQQCIIHSYYLSQDQLTKPVIKNMDDFYKAYAIKKGDKMYMDRQDRLTIWWYPYQ